MTESINGQTAAAWCLDAAALINRLTAALSSERARAEEAEKECEAHMVRDYTGHHTIIANWFDLAKELDVPAGGSVFETVIALKAEVERLREALEMARDDFWDLGNQAGGYVDMSTPKKEADFLLLLDKRAGVCAEKVAAAIRSHTTRTEDTHE